MSLFIALPDLNLFRLTKPFVLFIGYLVALKSSLPTRDITGEANPVDTENPLSGAILHPLFAIIPYFVFDDEVLE